MNSFVNCYCTSGALYAFDGEIHNVTVGTLNNTSTCVASNQLYTDFTTTVPAASLGQSSVVPISILAASCGGSYPGGAKIYIDYNQDGLFTGTGEEAFFQGGFTYSPGGFLVSGNITIPATATLGTTRMRVIMQEGGTAATIVPCGTYGYGETEDYLVTITTPPTCPAPSALVASPVTTTGATLNWTENGTATQWRVEYGAQGFTPGTGTFVTVNTTPSTVISGLSASTAYSFYVRAICSASDSSTQTGPMNFSTPQILAIPPYSQNWETGGTDWTYSNGAQPNKWHVGTATSNTGVGSLYISNTNGVTNAYDINAASIVHAFRDFDFTALSGTIPVAFNWKGMGEVGWDFMNVWIVPLSFTPTPGTAITVASGGVKLNPSELSNQSAFTAANLTIPATFAGGTGRLILEWIDDTNTGTQPPAAVDNLTVGGAPLAIGLLDIKAVNIGSRNRVDWSTESELASDKFELERSADGRNFTKLSTVNAKGQASTYSYWDETPVAGVNHYRLKMVDANGNFTYSETVTAKVRGAGSFTVEAYPNPVSDVLTVTVYGVTGNNPTVSISDVTGKVVKVVSVLNNGATINMGGFASGMYLVKYSDNNHTQTIKVNKK
jgi:hypothetical protein